MSLKEDLVIEEALQILDSRLRKNGKAFWTPQESKQFLTLQLAEQKSEVFSIIFLDTRHRMIDFEKVSYGTIDGASVHPREVVKKVLKHNAAAVILGHNHPSGNIEPSYADQTVTQKLKDALELFNVRVLDHIIVGGTETSSFAEKGLL